MARRIFWLGLMLVFPIFPAFSSSGEKDLSTVSIWEEPLTIPTYEVGPPDRNPRFYTGRAYQGAQGRVYPYPMYDTLTDQRSDRTYRAVYIENEYLKVCVLPELGGRVFSAVDKSNGYELIYHQHVIKPALIGMLGAWVSGGIEWNLPHHHRATSALPVAHALKENADGSKTIWIGEMELRHRMRWTIALTLRPGSSCLEADVTLHNRTPFVNSFLHWANVAVHCGNDYQIIFPPRTRFAAYHAKKEFARWPISREVYHKTDYSEGVDISWWGNHPEPISFFAWNHEDDFLAGYDHGKKAGLVHVADHHVVPGKKFWVWGPGPSGRMWDKVLTDSDGPYVELMVGAYSDNQPDYSWIQPHEVKRASHCWYPIREMKHVKNANRAAAVNVELISEKVALVAVNTTASRPGARVMLFAGGTCLLDDTVLIAPDRPFRKEIALPAGTEEEDLRVSLVSAGGIELIAYQPAVPVPQPMPDPVEPPPDPKVIGSVEELYLAGLRLEQFHHPTMEPEPYYEEALRRDPGNSRVNRALGIRCLRRGMFEEAERYIGAALRRETAGYTRPRDGEGEYCMGLALRFQGKNNAAYAAFSRAAWSLSLHTAAHLQLAELDAARGDFASALDHADRAVSTNMRSAAASNLKSALLRHLGRFEEARQLGAANLDRDPLDFRAGAELHLACSALGEEEEAARLQSLMLERMGDDVQSYLELAADYGNCGMWDEAIDVLVLAAESTRLPLAAFPMVHYYLGYFFDCRGDEEAALRAFARAAEMRPDCCFPFRLESIEVLRSAIRKNPDDARAHYFLGNLLYECQPGNAIREWERAANLEKRPFPTLFRNLGIAYSRVGNDADGAWRFLQRAVAYDSTDPRLFFEMDVLAEEACVPPEVRLKVLRKHHDVVKNHNDPLSREVVLLVQLGFFDEAIEYLTTHHFRRWEGVGNVHGTFVNAHLLRGLDHLEAKRFDEAVRDFETALSWPENLEVPERYHGGRACQVNYWIGLTHEMRGHKERARKFYDKAAHGENAPSGRSAWGYYRGLALRGIGHNKEADGLFDELIRTGDRALEGKDGVSFFAKFGEKTRERNRLANAHYLMGLGFLGKGEEERAGKEFEEALSLNINHLWAKRHLDALH